MSLEYINSYVLLISSILRYIFQPSFYEKTLRSSGFDESLNYCKKNTTTPAKRNRSRNITWFNPPYSKNVQTNVAKTFLNLIKKHFPPNHNLRPIFNRNNVKVSFTCMPNMGSIINNHNNKILGLALNQVKNICLGCCAPGSFMTVWRQPESAFHMHSADPVELRPS